MTRGMAQQNFNQRSRLSNGCHVHKYVNVPICLFVAYLSENLCSASLNVLGIKNRNLPVEQKHKYLLVQDFFSAKT